MNAFAAWIRSIRPVNLAILAATQFGLRYLILAPNFEKYGMHFSLDGLHFSLLVLSALLVCAGGYLINDYYDIASDKINKPSKVLVGRMLPKRRVYAVYLILSAAGLALGIYLSIYLHFWKLVTIHVITIVLLFFYSASYKRIALLGNLVVALLTALSIIMIGAFEPHLYQLVRDADYYAADLCWRYILGLALFAFLLTVVREIIKDMEDKEGDAQSGARTIPVAWGMQAARGITCGFIAFTVLMMAFLIWRWLDFNADLNYIILFALVCVVLFHIFYRTLSATTQKQFAYLSVLVKVAMLLGLLVMPLYYFTEFR